jgi:Tol biopolymer transport system component
VYSRNDATGYWQIYKIPSSGGAEIPLTSDSYDHEEPEWSPDGNWIVYTKWDVTEFAQIYKVSSSGGTEAALTSDSFTHYGPQWSFDGNWVVYNKWDAAGYGQIYRVSSSGGAEIPLTSDNYHRYYPQWSPDGDWIVYRKDDATGYHQIYKISSGTGIEETERVNNQTGTIRVYPNPFTTMVNIEYSGIRGVDKISMQVYDISGRLIKTLTTNNISLGADLSPGVYFLKVVNPGAGMVKDHKLIKIVKL